MEKSRFQFLTADVVALEAEAAAEEKQLKELALAAVARQAKNLAAQARLQTARQNRAVAAAAPHQVEADVAHRSNPVTFIQID